MQLSLQTMLLLTVNPLAIPHQEAWTTVTSQVITGWWGGPGEPLLSFIEDLRCTYRDQTP